MRENVKEGRKVEKALRKEGEEERRRRKRREMRARREKERK